MIEPNPVVPKGMKKITNQDITYPTLHNNMDKAYVVRDQDTIPEGVKETGTIESFLNKVYTTIGISPEMEITVEVSPKIDGVSVNGTVDKTLLVNPQSRGDEDKSPAIIGMNGLQVCSEPVSSKPFGIQYECFVTEEDRVKASEYLGTNYVSCRSAASGILHRLQTGTDDNLLMFISLYPINSEGLLDEDGEEMAYAKRMDVIKNYGIIPSDMIQRRTITGNMEDLMTRISMAFKQYEDMRAEKSFEYDGIVLTVVDDSYQQILGRSGRTNQFQIALKFNPETAFAHISGITLDSGKKGYRTIQVNLDHPVFIDGVRYDHVPVASVGIFRQLGLRQDTEVKISRTGDVIPALTVKSEGTGRLIDEPKVCPACGERLTVMNGKYYCENPSCKDNIAGRFSGFFAGLDMTGYSDSFGEFLYEKLHCESIADLLNITEDQLRTAGANSDLKEALGSHRDFEVIGSLGLPGIGNAKAKKLLSFVSFKKLTDPRTSTMDITSSVIGAFGNGNEDYYYPITLAEKLTRDPIHSDLVAIGPYVTNITKNFKNIIRVGHSGGDIPGYLRSIIRTLGYEVVDGQSFDILVVPTINHQSKKVQIATDKNIPVMTQSMFYERYKDEARAVEQAG